jgi:DNA replication protein DnaC
LDYGNEYFRSFTQDVYHPRKLAVVDAQDDFAIINSSPDHFFRVTVYQIASNEPYVITDVGDPRDIVFDKQYNLYVANRRSDVTEYALGDRLIERRVKAAGFRDQRTLGTFDWKFNSLDRALIFDLANGRFIEQHEDVLLLGNAGVGKSHVAQAIGMAAIHAGFRVLYREAHVLFEDLLLANAIGERAATIATYSDIPLLIIDDSGMRKLPANAAEDLLEIVMRRYERVSTILTSNRPLDDWPTLFGDMPAVAAFLDRLMHHSHLIEIRGKSYRLHEHSLTARSRKAKATA